MHEIDIQVRRDSIGKVHEYINAFDDNDKIYIRVDSVGPDGSMMLSHSKEPDGRWYAIATPQWNMCDPAILFGGFTDAVGGDGVVPQQAARAFVTLMNELTLFEGIER